MHQQKINISIHKLTNIIEVGSKNRHARFYKVGANAFSTWVPNKQVNGKALNKYK